MSNSADELLTRFRQALQAWKWADRDETEFHAIRAGKNRPANAKAFPGLGVGDFLYSVGELCHPVGRYLIVAQDEDGAVLVIHTPTALDDPIESHTSFWATDGFHTTPEAAIAAECESDIEYHMPRLERAQQILQAIRYKRPYEYLLVDIDDD